MCEKSNDLEAYTGRGQGIEAQPPPLPIRETMVVLHGRIQLKGKKT